MNDETERKRILLVEDDEVDAIALRRSLDPWEVERVETLADALTKLSSGSFDAIACDLGLPDTDAHTAVRSLIAAKPTRVPLVVLTGSDDDELASTLIQAGAQEFITKHEMSAKALFRRFRLAIERSGQLDEAEVRQRAVEAWARSGQFRWEWRADDDMLRVSDEWSSALGLTGADAPSTVWLDRIHKDDKESFQADLLRLIRNELHAVEVRHRIRMNDERYRYFSARIVALRSDAGVRLLGSHSDVTDEFDNFCGACGSTNPVGRVNCRECAALLSPPPALAETLDVPGDTWHGAVVSERFRIERNLGAGAGGSVYLATDTIEAKRVALKFLHPWLLTSEHAVRRFESESSLQMELEHPNIVRVVARGEYRGHRFLALEYAAGGSLADAIDNRGALPLDETLRLFIPLLDGLQAAHDAGIVHRDVKPSNILLANSKGRVVACLTDFGVAKWNDSNATQTGAVIGTAMYMAPEQFASSKDVDARADIYAAGATLYHALCGGSRRGPAWGENEYPRLRTVMPHLPPQIDDAIAKAMSFIPDERFQTCSEFARALFNSETTHDA